jgi:hypothetical protein
MADGLLIPAAQYLRVSNRTPAVFDGEPHAFESSADYRKLVEQAPLNSARTSRGGYRAYSGASRELQYRRRGNWSASRIDESSPLARKHSA